MDVANGPGVRTTLFVTGCSHQCPGCFNKDLQDFEAGDQWTKEKEDEILYYIDKKQVVGINLLGGEPLEQTMDQDLEHLLKKIKYREKSVWLWTGFIFEDCLKDEKKLNIIKYCDVLVDGPFVEAKRDIKLKYRGSANQRVIDVKKSLESGHTILYKFDE